jgi:two-component system, chemotaxis family, protein-glutamate methylesterase/glutaminase
MATAEKRVLIVDDAAMMRMVIRNLLGANKRYHVVGACANGAEALEQLKTLNPDIILVDIEMPVMDGLTFLRNARLKTRAKIVILSSIAGAGSAKAHEARSLGADAVLQKPSGSVSLDLVEKSGHEILDTLQRLAP